MATVSAAMNILLLEDDPEASGYVARGLREVGHQVHAVADGRSALADITTGDFDILILDRMAPHLDGLSVLRVARAAGCRAPAIMLTAMSRVEDRVEGLEAGADDYLSKPFAFAELAARVSALGRRPPVADTVTLLTAADLEMDLLRRTVRRAGRAIDLQAREFSLLEQLMRRPGEVVTRTMLLERVWSLGFDPKTNIVESHMSRLRTKLDAGSDSAPLIRTVRGVGYIIAVDAS